MFTIGQDTPDLRSQQGFPTIRPRVSHRLPTAACIVWGIAPVDSPWKTLPARPGTGSLAPADSMSCCRVSTPAPAPRVFHASSTAPVPRQTGGAVGEGWKTQLSRIEWGDVPYHGRRPDPD